jgi:hypothetical protein
MSAESVTFNSNMPFSRDTELAVVISDPLDSSEVYRDTILWLTDDDSFVYEVPPTLDNEDFEDISQFQAQASTSPNPAYADFNLSASYSGNSRSFTPTTVSGKFTNINNCAKTLNLEGFNNIVITNIKGQVVYSKKNIQRNKNITFSGASGIYFYKGAIDIARAKQLKPIKRTRSRNCIYNFSLISSDNDNLFNATYAGVENEIDVLDFPFEHSVKIPVNAYELTPESNFGPISDLGFFTSDNNTEKTYFIQVANGDSVKIFDNGLTSASVLDDEGNLDTEYKSIIPRIKNLRDENGEAYETDYKVSGLSGNREGNSKDEMHFVKEVNCTNDEMDFDLFTYYVLGQNFVDRSKYFNDDFKIGVFVEPNYRANIEHIMGNFLLNYNNLLNGDVDNDVERGIYPDLGDELDASFNYETNQFVNIEGNPLPPLKYYDTIAELVAEQPVGAFLFDNSGAGSIMPPTTYGEGEQPNAIKNIQVNIPGGAENNMFDYIKEELYSMFGAWQQTNILGTPTNNGFGGLWDIKEMIHKFWFENYANTSALHHISTISINSASPDVVNFKLPIEMTSGNGVNYHETNKTYTNKNNE